LPILLNISFIYFADPVVLGMDGNAKESFSSFALN
jgi:hypothetical protein